jgi:methyltransferase (TIGR00027 family)
VRDSKPSASAQQVALVRAHLTSVGVLDDPLAATMLRSPWRELERLLRRRPLARIGHNPTFAYLAARTRFFDEAVRDAIDAGAAQVVIVGAGYDSRAWRLRRAGVRFFEIDHPATQADKRRRAPVGDVVYVSVDLARADVVAALRAAGFADQATVFVVEGLLLYLAADRVHRLLADLSRLGAPASRLVTNVGIAVAERHRLSPRRLLRQGLVALRGEPFRFRLSPDQARAFLARTGWTITSTCSGPQVAERYLSDTGLPARNLLRDDIAFLIAEKRTSLPDRSGERRAAALGDEEQAVT